MRDFKQFITTVRTSNEGIPVVKIVFVLRYTASGLQSLFQRVI